ncbi:MAG: choice-of-anchor J domain-containing protein [Phycisphaerales bacterium]|nr:choice-of-anchor J domain-containing protein [Phycisphaerales bacterium]
MICLFLFLCPFIQISAQSQWEQSKDISLSEHIKTSGLGSLPSFLVEYFDTACTKSSSLPSGWVKYSTEGLEEWNCFEHIPGNFSMRIYGNDGVNNKANTDWLISPKLDMSAPDAMGIAFQLWKRYSGIELAILVSNDYIGSGSPDAATWSSLALTMSPSDTARWRHYISSTISHSSLPLSVGFKYTSTSTSAYDIRIDSFITLIKTGIPETVHQDFSFKILGSPTNHQINLMLTSDLSGATTIQVFNSIGQLVYTTHFDANAQTQLFHIAESVFPSGLYLIQLQNNHRQSVQKCLIP